MILAFIQRYLTAGLAFLALTGWFYGGIQTYRLQGLKLKNAEATGKAEKAARNKEAQWQQDAATADEVHDEEVTRIHAEHVRDLERLRNRPAKRLPETPASCSGASPTALSAEDSAVARGWGTEFDLLRAEYQKCFSANEMRE